MRTVRDTLETRINGSPYLRDALGRGLINMSSLARELAPEVAIDLRKPVSVPSVLMALKRYAETLEPASGTAEGEFGDLLLRSNLVQFTVANSTRLMPILGELLLRQRSERSSFVLVNRSLVDTAILLSSDLRADLEAWLANETVIDAREQLSAISLRRTCETSSSSFHVPLQTLAWANIDVVNVNSTSSELVLVVNDEDVDRALRELRQALQPIKGKS